MAYQSLYRKYRPQTFSDVVGQGHVVRTLQNALTTGRVAHGYLFTGTRGTAKTTVARLLAKALNCESATHPVAEPCNHCEACRSITAGSAVDVIEMDAASHRGVSDIEEVRRAVGYGPMQLRYKVFIIDEAHQLSSDAKDAFLKTLEEPPANVVFILATTEPQAIPITIRSRCQQFDFKRGSIAEITSRLRYVLDCEGVSYTTDAVTLVARGAEGSYRDSLSLLEQVLAFTPTQITTADVETVLGSLDAEMLSKVVYAVAERNAPETFALAGQILDAGKEARTLLRTLSLHFRDLMLVSVGGPAVSAEMTPEEVQRLQVEARLFTPTQMMKAMDVLNEAQGETRWNNQHRLLTELTFLKLMNLGGVAGEVHDFKTAPIVFNTAPVQETVPIITKAPTVIPTTPPVAIVPSVPPTVAATPVPAPEATPIEEVPMTDEASEIADVLLPEAELDAKDYFAADVAADSDEIDDYGFAPVTDEDAPAEDDSFPTFAPIQVNVPAPTVAFVEAVPEPAPVIAPEPEEWKLFADDPQPGPGLFDDVPEPVIKAESPPPKIAPPPLPTTGEPDFPTSRERNPQPPALSLENAEEATTRTVPVRPAARVPVPVASSISEEEPNPSEPPVTLAQVKAVWNSFLRDTERFSRMTYIYLQKAEPTQIAAGRTVVLTIHHRPYYEMLLDKPKAQAFIKKLLARVLQRETIGLRLELDPTQAIPTKRVRVAESQDKKKRYDRIAALEALDAPTYPASVATAGANGATFGFGGGQGYAPPRVPTPPVPERNYSTFDPATGSSSGEFANVSTRQERSTFVRESAPSPRFSEAVDFPTSASGSEKRTIALAEPLVQEVLTIFGGDIVTD